MKLKCQYLIHQHRCFCFIYSSTVVVCILLIVLALYICDYIVGWSKTPLLTHTVSIFKAEMYVALDYVNVIHPYTYCGRLF